MGATNVLAKFAGDECLDEGGEATAFQILDETETYFKAAADGAAATATTDQWLWTNNTGGAVSLISATFVTLGAGITADNTNFATIQIKADNGIGGASAVALSITTAITDSGNFAASTTKTMTLRNGTNALVPAGGNVYFAITKSGTGVVVPISAATVRVRKAN